MPKSKKSENTEEKDSVVEDVIDEVSTETPKEEKPKKEKSSKEKKKEKVEKSAIEDLKGQISDKDKELAKLSDEINELKATMLRRHADFENHKTKLPN